MKESRKENWEKFWYRGREVAEVYSNADRIIRNLVSFTPLKGKKILEVGGGTGRDGFRLVDEGATVFLLDYAESSLEIMKELAAEEGKAVQLIKGDALHLPIANGRCDVVFHQGLLEHFRDPLPILKENARVLKSGGVALVDVPQRYHIYTVIKHLLIFFHAWFAGWETEFSVGQLEALLERVGLTVRRSYGEWMRPSLFYRMLREVLLKMRIKLPLYPKGLGFFPQVRTWVREFLLSKRVSLYICLNIGVLATKESG